MRQRAMIAMALVNNPQLLIADEPTTALDVTVQAQILDLLQDLQREYGSAIVLITHDLGVIAEIADDVLVMYGGRAVESGPTKSILTLPEMPYTWGLLSSVPDITGDTGARLIPIPGTPPSLLNPPEGCAFHPRCPHSDKVPGDLCRTTLPELAQASVPGHLKRCHLVNPDEIYLKEVLPEAAPDLLDPETGELIPELQEQIDEIQGEQRIHPTEPFGRSAPRGGRRLQRGPRKIMTDMSIERPNTAVAGGKTLLEVRNLVKYFPVLSSGVIRRVVGHVQAVDGVSFAVPRGGSLGLVGESGCGKSTTGRVITRLYEPTGARCSSRARTWPSCRSGRCCRCAKRSR